MDRCKYCGEPLTERSKFCPNCGQAREADPTSKEAEFELEEAEFELEEAEFELEPEEDPAAQGPEAEPAAEAREDSKPKPEQPGEPTWQPEQPGYTEPPKDQRPEPAPEKKHSKLSIWALVCVLLVIPSGLGTILAIVDLAKKDREHKHNLSVAALITCGALSLLLFVLGATVGKKFAAEAGAASPTAYSARTTAKPASKTTAKPASKATARPAAKATQATKQTQKPARTAAATKAPQAVKTTTNSKVVSILYGNGTLAGVREDGTVALTGFKSHMQKMDVSGWTNIVSIDSNGTGDYLVGLKGDGTVVGTGEIRAAALQEMASWRNIVSLEAADSYGYVLGVRADGTVVGVNVNREPAEYEHLLEAVGQWTDIAYVRVFSADAYGRKKDGTWVSTEYFNYNYWTKRYEDATDIFNTGYDPVLLYPNGTVKVLAEHMDYDISGWRGMKKIILRGSLAIGLKKDGTVVAVPTDNMREHLEEICSAVLGWRDIVDIAGDSDAIVGLKQDGTLMFARSVSGFDEKEWTQTTVNAAQTKPRLTPAPMRAASKKDDSAAKKKAVEKLKAEEASKNKKKYTKYYGRTDYINSLKNDFSEDVIWYALNHSGIDWKAHAVSYARQQVLEKENYRSAKQLARDLRIKLYSEEEIAYAKAHWNLNFKDIAVKRAQRYIANVKDDPWTKERMIRQLEFEWFTPEEAAYAAGKLGLK